MRRTGYPPPIQYPSPPLPSITNDLINETGGWNPTTGTIPREINAQIDQAFANVDLNLRHAGGKGWSQVYRVNSYHVPINDEALEAMVRNFHKWVPGHEPIWTCVGVTRLGEEDMRVEIEVVAHVP
jgi:enamine deaminase RidA (YjgF/YER057c/UK114 family)